MWAVFLWQKTIQFCLGKLELFSEATLLSVHSTCETFSKPINCPWNVSKNRYCQKLYFPPSAEVFEDGVSSFGSYHLEDKWLSETYLTYGTEMFCTITGSCHFSSTGLLTVKRSHLLVVWVNLSISKTSQVYSFHSLLAGWSGHFSNAI